MFTYLKLKNFKSFDEVEFNFKKTNSETKKFVAIYGENGIGKTNFVTAYSFLSDSLFSLLFKNIAEKALENNINDKAIESDIDDKAKRISNLLNMLDFTKKMKNVRMIGNECDTEIEYGFEIDGTKGYYRIIFGDKLKSEELYYKVEKNRGIIFKINEKNEKIEKELNGNIFYGKEYKKDIETEIDKYWGKNTFLSIMLKEQQEKNIEFIQKNIKDNIFEVLTEFMKLSVVYRNSPIATIIQGISPKDKLLNNVSEGKIPKEKIEVLNKYEIILKDFFIQAYSDIKDVYYEKKENEDNKIQYKLYFKKKIANKLIDIEYEKESSGTRKILNQFNYIVGALWGETVIIDEIDNGIHDLLMKAIIESIKDEITGQLIITTHNTLLMETLNKDDIYIIISDYKGQKSVNCISDYDINVQKNNNIRELYLKGLFGGIPSINMIDFTEIKQRLNAKQQDNKGGI